MKKAAIIVVSGLILILSFAFLVYPTPYKYVQHKEGDSTYTVRVNVITGKIEALTLDSGWITIPVSK